MITADTILEIISAEAVIDRAKLVPTATLDDLAVTSLDIVGIIYAIEDKSGLTFSQEEFENVRTVGDLTNVILAKASPAGATQ